jgi:hypothetical protein
MLFHEIKVTMVTSIHQQHCLAADPVSAAPVSIESYDRVAVP